jgi:endoglucanase
MFNVYDLQKQLVESACPSGFEGEKIGPLLAKLAGPFVDEVTTDPLRNIICLKKGTGGGKKIMMAAHMDSIGFIVTYVDDNGFIWFDNLGGFLPAMLVNTRVRFLNGMRGIIRVKEAPKAVEKNLMQIKTSDLYIDIGTTDKNGAEKHVKLGDAALFEGESVRAAGGNIIGPYADDLIACTVLLMVMERVGQSSNDLYFVFTAQEEVGCRGAGISAFGIDPDIGIACDVCATGDTPLNDEVHLAVSLGKGPTIKLKDSSVICSPVLNDKLRKIATAEGIAWQHEILTGGGTDTCTIQSTHAGVHATCISVPTRNIHSPVEMFNIGDVEGAVALMTAAVTTKL